MSGHGQQNSNPSSNVTALHGKQRDLGPVFPGKPMAQQGNLAVKRSLIEIFDEFTQVISGELKSMNLEQFEAEQKKRKQ